ncbi:hypothetical protein DFH11DRAFT_152329 [Phellopilus nigrolimitatus]|nr:hypothetical protein DFH11DRAFT_152329 [Phellopilus nigrolimitatus]
MPPSYSSRPRPILKHSPAFSYSSSASPSPSPLGMGATRGPAVHFPPHPAALACTYAAHSPDAYDRSPIAVAPNECALPARGCPGRTYRLGGGGDVEDEDDDGDDGYTESTPGRAWKRSDHAHPRVRVLGFDTSYRSSSSGSESSRRSGSDSPVQSPPLPSSARPPPLIADLSSSDASEDSDHAFGPILDEPFSSMSMSAPHSHQRSPAAARLAKPAPRLSPKADPAQLAFLPHPHSHALAPPSSVPYPYPPRRAPFPQLRSATRVPRYAPRRLTSGRVSARTAGAGRTGAQCMHAALPLAPRAGGMKGA